MPFGISHLRRKIHEKSSRKTDEDLSLRVPTSERTSGLGGPKEYQQKLDLASEQNGEDDRDYGDRREQSEEMNDYENFELEFAAREWVGCVTAIEVEERRRRDGNVESSQFNVQSGPPLMETQLPSDFKYHYLPGCICRNLHLNCHGNSCPPLMQSKGSDAGSDDTLDLRKIQKISTLADAAGAGCWFCSVLLGAVQNMPGADQANLYEGVITVWEWTTGRAGCIVEVLAPWFDEWESFDIYKTRNDSNSFSCVNFPCSPEVPRSTALAGSFDFALRKMRECETEHSCGLSIVPPLPTRILEIRDDGGKYNVRLVVPCGRHAQYVTLSHCWGEGSLLTTTDSTLEERLFGIPWPLLPQTFRDAAYITHRLGYQYLWIDALCILQGNAIDWQLESSKMNSVYENCSLMISADHARNGNGGCFSNGVPPSWESVLRNGGSMGYYVRRTKVHAGLYSTTVSGGSDEAPLSKRGWAFQERALSPRILHYSTDELIWECNKTINCQCGALNGISSTDSTIKMHLANIEKADSCIIHGKVRLWHAIASEYSSRALTNPEDRLVALSGLAKRFQTCNYRASVEGRDSAFSRCDLGQYLAGLWSKTLNMGLMWSSTQPVKGTRTPYVAPSWSWASHSGEVYFTFSDPRTKVHFVEMSCIQSGVDPTGSVSAGQLKLSAPLVRLSLQPTTIELENSEGCRYFLASENGTRVGSFQPDVTLQSLGMEYRTETAGKIVFGLNISETFALVLRKSMNKETFERIGVIFSQQRDPTLKSVFAKATAPIITII